MENNEETPKCVMCNGSSYKIAEKTKEHLCENCWEVNEGIKDGKK